MIFILNKQEKVVNILRNGGGANQAPPFFDDIYSQDLATGAETFSFSTIAVNNVASDLVVGNYVAFKNDEGEYKLFQITQTEEYHEDAMYMNVYAEGAGLELINKVFRARKSPSTSLRKFMEMVLDETGWNVGAIPLSAQESLDLDLEDATVYATLQNTLSKYGVEMAFRCEINNGRISSKFVDLYTQRGRVTGKRFSFGRDIEGIKRKVDSTELFTALIGRGNKDISFKDVTVDGINKPLGQDFVADQEAFDRYNNNGYHIVGIFKYDTDSPEELLRETYKHLEKCKDPKIEYEVSVALLGELLGESWNKVRIGDTVAIVDNAFNPPIHLMARVSKLEKSFTDNQSDTCTLSNFIEVGSNITDEMRKISSKLEGYVDAQFPIGGDKIQDGAIGQEQMNQEYMSQVSADIISASVIQAENIIAENIEAVNGRFENIEAEHGNFKEITAGKIEAVEGKFNEINADLGNFKEISTDKISAVEGKFDKVQADLVKTNTIVAGLGEFDLVVTDRINAVDGKFETIKSELGDFKEITTNKLTATEGRIEELDSDLITTKTIVGNLGKFDDVIAERVDAVEGTFVELEAEVGRINTLVSGNITSDNIHSSGISSDKLTIRDGFIKNAMIDTLNASKITAGEINTNKVHITSANGGIVIADNTQQFKDKNGKVRIQMGQDASGNFNFGVFDATGSGTLIDATGVKEKALADGIIKDRMIGQGEIGGNKINISSMIDEVNKESNTKTIKGSKVQLDTQGQTLDVAFNTLKTNLDVLEVGGINILLTTEKTKEIISNGGTNKTGASYSLSLPSSEIQGKDTRFQFKWEYIGDTPSGTFRFQTGAPQYRQIDNTISISENNTSGEVSVVWKPSTSSSFTSIGVRTDNMNGTLRISKVKLEKGTKETDWTPNPTEVAEKVESNTTAIGVQQGKIETLIQDTTIEKNGQSLKLKDEYSKLEQTVSGISSTVGSHTSSITNLGAQVDSKAKVFTSTPTVPYKVGDLWVQGSSGEIMKCKTARTTGSYNSSDWEKASKYTDDSKANQVESNLSNLSGKVTEVESKQATFKQDLDGFKQTVSNTYTTKTELSNTNKKVEGLTTTVENVSGSLETTKTQVAGIVTNLDSITQRVSSTETNVESVIETSNTALSTANQNKADIGKKANATDVYKKSETYTKNQTDSAITTAKNEITLGVSQTYETKTNVENKISTAMNNIQIGGRNLLKGTSSLLKEFTMNEWNCLPYGYLLSDLGLKVGDKVAFKLYLKFENTLCGGSSRITFYDTAGTNIKTVQNTTYIKPNSEGYSEVTTVIPTNAVRIAVGAQREVAGGGLAHFKFQIKEPKLEQGTKCSSWTPAPEDVDSALGTKANSSDVYTKSEVYTKSQTDSAINVAKDAINLGVSQTYETKSNVESKISSANTTTLNSAKSYADTKKSEAISTASSDATNKVNSAKNELNTAINKKANSTDVYTKSQVYTKEETNSQINIAKNEINLGVSNTYETKTNVENKINTAVNNVQIGGRNLIRKNNIIGSGCTLDTNNYIQSGSISLTSSTQWGGIEFTVANVKPNTKYILSFRLQKTSGNLKNIGGHCDATWSSNTMYVDKVKKGSYSASSSVTDNTNKYFVEVYFTTPETVEPSHKIYVQPNRNDTTSVGVLIEGLKLEEGTKSTDWVPAPEDVNALIDKKANSTDVYTKSEVYTKSQTDSAINVAKDNINLSVSNTYETKSNVETKISSAKTEAINTASSDATQKSNSALNSAKSYADTKKTEAINSASADATSKVNSAKNELNTAISKKANSTDVYTKSEVYTKSQTDSAINVAKEEINLSVSNTYETKSNVESKISGIKVGGDNILRNGNFVYGMNNWSAHDPSSSSGSNKSVTVGSGGDWIPPGKKALQIKGTRTTDRYGVISSTLKLIPNTTYTISGYCAGHRVSNIQLNVRDFNNNSANIFTKNVGVVSGGNTLDKWKRFEETFTTNSHTDFALNLYAVNFADNGYVWFTDVQIQQGTKATAWTPCFEDVDSDINKKANSSDVYTKSEVYTKNETNAQISATTNAITSRVSSLESKEVANRKVTAFRYVRDWLRGSTANGGNHWVELQVWANGSNIAQGKTVTTNGTVNSSYPINRFTDGNISSSQYVEATKHDSSWVYLQVDLGEVHYNIDYLRVWHYYDDSRRYNHKLEVSVDGSTWYTIYNTEISGTYKETADGRVHIINETSTEKRLKTAENKITDSAIINTVSSTIQSAKNEAINSANSSTDNKLQSYATNSSLTQTANNITASFKASGGYNLIANSTGYNGTNLWSNSGATMGTAIDNNIGGATNKFMYLDNGTKTTESFAFSKRFKLKSNTKYTLSGWFNNYTKCPNFDVFLLSSTTVAESVTDTSYTNAQLLIGAQNTSGSWKKFSITFTTPANTISGYIRIDNNGYNASGTNSNRVHWSALMLNEGEEQPWTPHPNEIYSGSTVIDASGVTVNNGALRVKDNSGNIMLEGDASGTLYLRKQLNVGTIGTFSPSGVNIAGGSFTVSGGTAYTESSTGYLEGSTTSQSLYNNGLYGSSSRINGSQIFRADSFYGTNGWSIYEDNSSNATQQSYKTYSRGSGIYIQATDMNKGGTGSFVEATRLNHEGLKTTGSITAGRYYLTDSKNAYLTNNSNTGVKIQSPHGYCAIGAQNSSYCHYVTDRPTHWFDRNVAVQGEIRCGSGYNQLVPYGSMYNGYDNGTSEVCEGRIHIGGNKYIYYGWCSINCTAGASAERTYTVPNLSRIRGISIQCYTKGGTANFGELALKQTYSNGFTFRLYNATNGGAHYITYMIIGE